MTVAGATQRDHMESGATCQSKLGGGGAGCGQTETGSQQRQEREEDGWMGVTRERETPILVLICETLGEVL